MINHAVVIAGGGPTGLMLAGELALAGVDVAVVERRPNQELSGARALGIASFSVAVTRFRVERLSRRHRIADALLRETERAHQASRRFLYRSASTAF